MTTTDGRHADRELTITVSQAVYDLIQREIGLCTCTINGFVRGAIVKEIAARQRARSAATATAAGGTVASHAK